MTTTTNRLHSALNLRPADTVRYHRSGRGAPMGPGWYVRPFGGQTRFLGNVRAATLIAEARALAAARQ